MSCDETTRWIWETRHGADEPPSDVEAHLEACEPCSQALDARRNLGRQLMGMRNFYDADTPAAMDRKVLDAARAAILARETGSFEVDDELAALDEDLAAPAPPDIQAELDLDLPSTGRVSVRPGELAALERRPDWGRPRGQRPGRAAGPMSANDPDWAPPRAQITWMVAASMLLAASLVVGFGLGRATAPSFDDTHAALATVPAGTLVLQARPRVHSVGLSPEAVASFKGGSTYLLSGPVGGPYKVLGVVNWPDADMISPMPASDDSEIVVAVGPAGGWSTGKQLALNDLSDPEVEILGRRAVRTP